MKKCFREFQKKTSTAWKSDFIKNLKNFYVFKRKSQN